MKSIENASVLVAGVARNVEGVIERDLSALKKALVAFRHVEFLVVESDSSDATVKVLERLKKSWSNFNLLILGDLRNNMAQRTERLAHCRNQIVNFVVHHKEKDFDYVVIADLDGVNTSLTKGGIESCWQSDTEWDVVTANQNGPYYDIWALRHSSWSPNDCIKSESELIPLFGEKMVKRAAIRSRQLKLLQKPGLIEVQSAFGGLAIYRREAFEIGNYIGLEANGDEICEHVPFHRLLTERGKKIFINPLLLNRVQGYNLGGIHKAKFYVQRAVGSVMKLGRRR